MPAVLSIRSAAEYKYSFILALPMRLSVTLAGRAKATPIPIARRAFAHRQVPDTQVPRVRLTTRGTRRECPRKWTAACGLDGALDDAPPDLVELDRFEQR